MTKSRKLGRERLNFGGKIRDEEEQGWYWKVEGEG